MATAKVSLSLPETLVASVRHHVGQRGLSRYVAEALRKQLQYDRLAGLLDELEKEAGPIDPKIQKEVSEAWPDPAPSRGRRPSV